MESLGSRIRELRLKAKMSQADLAFDLEGGTTTVSNYENNEREPSFSNLKKVAEALSDYHGDTLYYLITGQHPSADLLSEQFKSQHVRKEELMDQLTEYIELNVDSKNIRLSGRLTPRKFAAMFVKDKFGITEGSIFTTTEKQNGA